MSLYPRDAANQDLALRQIFCHFLAGSLHILLARQEDVVELQVWHLWSPTIDRELY
jgi:hypothetical protein